MLELGAVGEWLAAGQVRPPVSGTATRVAVAAEPMEAGAVVLDVNLMPVVLAEGDVPAFRELSEGAEGPDVAQLQAFLRAQDFEGGEADGDWGEGTTVAVQGWQESLGVPQSGVVPAGMVVFVPELPVSLRSLVEVGDQVGAGEPVAEVLADEPQFRAIVTEDQLAMAEEGARVTLSRDGVELTGVAGPSTEVEGATYMSIVGQGTDPLCQIPCAEVPQDAPSRWTAQVEVQPTESGVVLPLGAIRTAADGSRFVVTDAGADVPVTTGASAGGQVIVTGVDAGTAVRMPYDDELDTGPVP